MIGPRAGVRDGPEQYLAVAETRLVIGRALPGEALDLGIEGGGVPVTCCSRQIPRGSYPVALFGGLVASACDALTCVAGDITLERAACADPPGSLVDERVRAVLPSAVAGRLVQVRCLLVVIGGGLITLRADLIGVGQRLLDIGGALVGVRERLVQIGEGLVIGGDMRKICGRVR